MILESTIITSAIIIIIGIARIIQKRLINNAIAEQHETSDRENDATDRQLVVQRKAVINQLKVRNAAIRIILSALRSNRAYATTRRSITTIQNNIRRHLAQKHYTIQRNAITLIQSTFRSNHERKTYATTRRFITAIQNNIKRYLAQKYHTNQRTAASLNQSNSRLLTAEEILSGGGQITDPSPRIGFINCFGTLENAEKKTNIFSTHALATMPEAMLTKSMTLDKLDGSFTILDDLDNTRQGIVINQDGPAGSDYTRPIEIAKGAAFATGPQGQEAMIGQLIEKIESNVNKDEHHTFIITGYSRGCFTATNQGVLELLKEKGAKKVVYILLDPVHGLFNGKGGYIELSETQIPAIDGVEVHSYAIISSGNHQSDLANHAESTVLPKAANLFAGADNRFMCQGNHLQVPENEDVELLKSLVKYEQVDIDRDKANEVREILLNQHRSLFSDKTTTENAHLTACENLDPELNPFNYLIP